MTRVLHLALAACTAAAAADAPDVATFSLPISRVVVVRLKNGTDMLDGLRQAVAREKIKNAVIMSGFGSVTSYHVHVVDNTTFPPKDVFTSEHGPFDLLAIGGLVPDGPGPPPLTPRSTKQTTARHPQPGTSPFNVLPHSLR